MQYKINLFKGIKKITANLRLYCIFNNIMNAVPPLKNDEIDDLNKSHSYTLYKFINIM